MLEEKVNHLKEATYDVVGLMSGTSLDGLDMAFCRFVVDENRRWKYGVLKAQTVSYPQDLRDKLATCMTFSGLELMQFDVDLGRFFATQVNAFLRDLPRPQLIASHGHTVFHQPARGLTVQIGSGATIAALTGIATVCDFRCSDVARGGQGAPLVPMGDQLLFSEYGACLNLGGFANISFEDERGARRAFDVSPCNMALNGLAQQLGIEYDAGGALARSGNPNEELLRQLNDLPIYQELPRPSLAKEWFDSAFLPLLARSGAPTVDKLRTVCEHIAMQVGAAASSAKATKMLITGGGALNHFLIERISQHTDIQIVIPDDLTLHFKEAIIFALLGILRWRGEINCLKSVTHANRDNIGGSIYC